MRSDWCSYALQDHAGWPLVGAVGMRLSKLIVHLVGQRHGRASAVIIILS